MTTSTYDEALERFHRTGPEFNGWLSNHGPMVIEVLARRGESARIHSWTDRYLRRLDERPRGRWPIAESDWRDVLGDASRTGDWLDFMLTQVQAAPWRDVLAHWWPRLLPGIAAGATHGVIRTGHAVQALAELETPARLDELAHALGYWAARWQAVPLVRASGRTAPADLIPNLPRVARQTGGIRSRLAQLADVPDWPDRAGAVAAAPDAGTGLARIRDAVVARYPEYAYGAPTLLVHAATAPNAVAMMLTHLPTELHRPSLDAAWTATAAVLAAYRPATPAPVTGRPRPLDETWQAVLDDGGEHLIKFTDAVLTSFEQTGDPISAQAAATALALDA